MNRIAWWGTAQQGHCTARQCGTMPGEGVAKRCDALLSSCSVSAKLGWALPCKGEAPRGSVWLSSAQPGKGRAVPSIAMQRQCWAKRRWAQQGEGMAMRGSATSSEAQQGQCWHGGAGHSKGDAVQC